MIGLVAYAVTDVVVFIARLLIKSGFRWNSVFVLNVVHARLDVLGGTKHIRSFSPLRRRHFHLRNGVVRCIFVAGPIICVSSARKM